MSDVVPYFLADIGGGPTESRKEKEDAHKTGTPSLKGNIVYSSRSLYLRASWQVTQ